MTELMLGLRINSLGPNNTLSDQIPQAVIDEANFIKLFPHDVRVTRSVEGVKPVISPYATIHRRQGQTSPKISELETITSPFTSTVRIVKASTSAKVLLDLRTNFDSVDDLDEVLDAYLGAINGEDAPELARPDMMMISGASNREVLETFVRKVESEGIIPVCFTTSSRATKADYKDLERGKREHARKTTKRARKIGFEAIMMSGADAQIGREIGPSLKIFSTGVFSEITAGRHKRAVHVDLVKDSSDAIVASTSVLRAADPVAAAKSLTNS